MFVQNWPYIRNETFPNQNPYWVQKRNQNDNFLNYSTSSFRAIYKVFDWLKIQGRITYDDSYSHYEKRDYASSQATVEGPNGGYAISNSKSDSFYSDLLLTGNKNINQNINLAGTVGFSHSEGNSSGIDLYSTIATSLQYPNFFSVYALNGLFNKSESLIKTVSEALFANATVGYKDQLFLDVTARNDWTSTT